MNERTEALKQVWRRAALLTGDRERAERVLVEVLRVQENPLKLGRARRDRLIVQRAREVGARGELERPILAGDGLSAEARQLLEAARALPQQSYEAWLLLEVEGLEEIDGARAMDCSRTAMNRFRSAALDALRPLLGERYDDALASLRRSAETLDPAPSLERIAGALQRIRRRRRLVSLAQVLLLLVCMAVITWVGWDLIRSSDREKERSLIGDTFSSPMPDGDEPSEVHPELRRQEQAPAAGREIKRSDGPPSP